MRAAVLIALCLVATGCTRPVFRDVVDCTVLSEDPTPYLDAPPERLLEAYNQVRVARCFVGP